jgi:hypothetical protein
LKLPKAIFAFTLAAALVTSAERCLPGVDMEAEVATEEVVMAGVMVEAAITLAANRMVATTGLVAAGIGIEVSLAAT